MQNSAAHTSELLCPKCQQTFSVEVWQVVDFVERPDLLERLRAGTLHDVFCSHCGYGLRLGASLLIFCPGQMPPLLFSPAPQVDEAAAQQDALKLLDVLRSNLGSDWRSAWLEDGLPSLPRPILMASLPDSPDRPWLEDMSVYPRLEVRARQRAEGEPLLQAIRQFIYAPDLGAARSALEQHPGLLSDEVDELLAHLVETTSTAKDETVNQIFKERHNLLRRCREFGIDIAFAEGVSSPPEFEEDLRAAKEAEHDYLREDAEQALDSAGQAWQRILAHPAFPNAPHWFRLGVWMDAANLFLRRYIRHNAVADLNIAIRLWQQALEATSLDSPDRPVLLNHLGSGFHDRYTRFGQQADLEQSIRLYQQAVRLTPLDLPDYPMLLNQLGNGLSQRYLHSGQLADLDQAIALYKQVVATRSPESRDYGRYLNNIGAGLRDRYSRSGDSADLEQSIAFHQQALAATEPALPDYPIILSNLGLALRDRYTLLGQLADLEQTISVFEQAVAATRPDSPDHPTLLNNLSTGLADRYALLGNLVDLEQVISILEHTVTDTSPDAPDRPRRLNNLGNALHDRYQRFGRTTDLEEAIRLYRQAGQLGSEKDSEISLISTRSWGRWALERRAWSEAIEAFGYSRRAIEQLLRVQVLRTGKVAWLSEVQGLYSELAMALVHDHNLPAALEALEHGRALLLSENLQHIRRDLERLPDLGHGDLLERYRALTHQYAALAQGEAPNRVPNWREVLDTHQLNLQAVIEAIRQISGYEDFLQLPTAAQIQAIAQDTALVYPIVTRAGALALVVTASYLEVVWSELDEDTLNGWLVQQQDNVVMAGYLPGQLGRTDWLEASLDTILPQLGERLIGPVAEQLRALGATDITLIPASRLGLLPLHAVTYQHDGQSLCLLDEFTVHYAPSTQGLQSAQVQFTTRSSQPTRLAGVGNPLPNRQPLIYGQAELEAIARLFDGRATALCTTEATKAALLEATRSATHLHFSCHGLFNPAEPLLSALFLTGEEPLTLDEILSQPAFNNARLVVLSACQTAVTDFNKLADEAIGFPAGFLQAGVPGVVGTLWPVDDLSTALMMIRFYTYHLKDGLAPAKALSQAQRWLRNVTNAELTELFDLYRQNATDRPALRMTYEAAHTNFREFMLRDPDQRPFAHPYYWAPFVFYGV